MPAHRVTMHKAREILRLLWDKGLSQRATGMSVGVSPGTVWDVKRRARDAGVGWPLPAELDDDSALEKRLAFHDSTLTPISDSENPVVLCKSAKSSAIASSCTTMASLFAPPAGKSR